MSPVAPWVTSLFALALDAKNCTTASWLASTRTAWKLDEAWSFVGKKHKNVKRHEIHVKGDQYIFIAMAGAKKAIVSWGVGKRNGESTMDLLHDLRSRVIGQPEISTDGFLPYRVAIRDAFGPQASHGVIVKTSA